MTASFACSINTSLLMIRKWSRTSQYTDLWLGLGCSKRQLTTAASTELNKQNETLYPKAKKVNGRFVLPWHGSGLPSSLNAMKWFLVSENNSNLPMKSFYHFDTEKLDRILPIIKPDKSLLDSPPLEDIQVTWLGHATVLLQMDGLNILTDPIFNDYCGTTRILGIKRYRPIPCTVNELPSIDAVCISHNHYDHLDYTTVCDLNKRFGAKLHWFVPMGLHQWMKDCGCHNVVELEWWDGHTHTKFSERSKSVKFVFTPAQHWCRRGLNDINKVLWGSWTIIGPQHRFFFAGDTGYCDIFKSIGKRYGPFDLAAIPIGAYEPRGLMKFQHCNPQEAVEIHRDVRSNLSLGIHWGTFNLSYEHYLDPPKVLSEILQNKGIPQEEFHTLKQGEIKIVKKERTVKAQVKHREAAI